MGTMTSSLPPSGSAKARLERRSQAVARLRHPNLVRMLPLPGGAGLQPLIGEAKRLADFTLPAGTFKRFELEQVVRLLLDVLSGLTALHEVVCDGEAFVHGEVCPQHVYIDQHGTSRLVPLLSSHLTGSARPEHTGYLAPERIAGEPIDARSDVFSVGVMLWEALSGRRLFSEPTRSAVEARLAERLVPQLSARDGWAQPLCAIALKAIALHPAERDRAQSDRASSRRALSDCARLEPCNGDRRCPAVVAGGYGRLAGRGPDAGLPAAAAPRYLASVREATPSAQPVTERRGGRPRHGASDHER
jgi:serine/threonine protein kinase